MDLEKSFTILLFFRKGETDGLARELDLYRQQITKWQLVRDMNDKEVEHFQAESQRIGFFFLFLCKTFSFSFFFLKFSFVLSFPEGEIVQAKANIEGLRRQIDEERRRKKNEEEYENLARVILQHPSTEQSSG